MEEIGEICQREKLWFHVDGAYAGSAFICEEYRYIMKGLQVRMSQISGSKEIILVRSTLIRLIPIRINGY